MLLCSSRLCAFFVLQYLITYDGIVSFSVNIFSAYYRTFFSSVYYSQIYICENLTIFYLTHFFVEFLSIHHYNNHFVVSSSSFNTSSIHFMFFILQNFSLLVICLRYCIYWNSVLTFCIIRCPILFNDILLSISCQVHLFCVMEFDFLNSVFFYYWAFELCHN